MSKLKIVIAAGGTGGHLFPAQQLAQMLKEGKEPPMLLFAGHKLEESPFFEREGIPFTEIAAHPLKKGFLGALWKGFWQAVRLLRQFSPDVVVGFGSYHTFPLLLAAAALRKKLILFEANCVMGKVNRFFAKVAQSIAFQFPLPLKRGIAVPLLPWRFERAPILSKPDARRAYGLEPERLTILVFGGSQGASFLNEKIPSVLARVGEMIEELSHRGGEMLRSGNRRQVPCRRPLDSSLDPPLKGQDCAELPVQVIHLTGKEAAEVQAAYRNLGITACVKGFEKEMARAYSAADMAVCRSGAGTVAELIYFEVPAVLVPYPFAMDDHQRKNGVFLADQVQGARLVIQEDASMERLASEIKALIGELETRREALCKAKAENQKRPHLADLVLAVRDS